jgi:hypothetical protein
VNALGPPNVAVTTGHMFRGKELDEAGQQAAEASIRRHAEQVFAAHDIGIVYGALACGADIILAETALERGAEIDAVLPFAAERFIETSVGIGDPPGFPGKWERRFRAILEGSHSARLLTIIDPMDPIERDLDDYFFYGFRYAAGCALQRAEMLQTACRLVVVSDEGTPDSVAGSNRAFADWRERGRPFDLIPYPHERAKQPMRERAASAFRPVILLWDASPDCKDGRSALDKLANAAGKGLARIDRTHRDGRRGICLIAASSEESLAAGLALSEAARAAKLSVRVVCDFGPVLGADLAPDKTLLARLQTADDFPGLPADCLLATEPYAAQVKFDLGDKSLLVPVGRAEVTAGAEDGERQAIRSRPSLPIYKVERTRVRQG